MTFELNIQLGNDAMSTKEDLADALLKVAHKVEFSTAAYGAIMDANGLKVGEWNIKEEL